MIPLPYLLVASAVGLTTSVPEVGGKRCRDAVAPARGTKPPALTLNFAACKDRPAHGLVVTWKVKDKASGEVAEDHVTLKFPANADAQTVRDIVQSVLKDNNLGTADKETTWLAVKGTPTADLVELRFDADVFPAGPKLVRAVGDRAALPKLVINGVVQGEEK